MRKIFLAVIVIYQRFISPFKGYSCAYRVHTMRPSCSAFGYYVIKRYGIWMGMHFLRKRFAACASIHKDHVRRISSKRRLLPHVHSQAGFCDISFDACEIADIGSCACDGMECFNSAPCDIADWWRSRRASEDRYVRIEPRSKEDKRDKRLSNP